MTHWRERERERETLTSKWQKTSSPSRCHKSTFHFPLKATEVIRVISSVLFSFLPCALVKRVIPSAKDTNDILNVCRHFILFHCRSNITVHFPLAQSIDTFHHIFFLFEFRLLFVSHLFTPKKSSFILTHTSFFSPGLVLCKTKSNWVRTHKHSTQFALVKLLLNANVVC